MAEYISREEVLEHLNKCKEDPLFDPDMARICFAISIFIENMQAADVQPVNRGKWICEFYNDVFDVYQADCSVCKKESTDKYDKVSESYEYCPHCGARMDGNIENAKDSDINGRIMSDV